MSRAVRLNLEGAILKGAGNMPRWCVISQPDLSDRAYTRANLTSRTLQAACPKHGTNQHRIRRNSHNILAHASILLPAVSDRLFPSFRTFPTVCALVVNCEFEPFDAVLAEVFTHLIMGGFPWSLTQMGWMKFFS